MRSWAVVFKIIIFVSSGLFFSCSSGKDGKKIEDVAPDYAEYGKASCAFKYDEGDEIDVTSSSKKIVSSYFGKKYDESLLNPVLSASASELIRFAETQTQVRYYKTKSNETNSCQFTSMLPVAPADLEALFSKVSSKRNILGMYNEADSPDLPSTRPHATIVVRSDSNKWILIHEYLHHLFEIQFRKENSQIGSDVQEDFFRTANEYENLKKEIQRSSDRTEKIKIAKEKLKKVSLYGARFLKESFLEEMAIEGILGDLMDKNQLTVVHPPQRINGAGYILLSAKNAEKLIQEIRDEVSEFQSLNEGHLDSKDRSDFNSGLNNYDGLESDIQRLKQKAKIFLSSLNLQFNGVAPTPHASFDSGHEPTSVCSHGGSDARVEEILRKWGSK